MRVIAVFEVSSKVDQSEVASESSICLINVIFDAMDGQHSMSLLWFGKNPNFRVPAKSKTQFHISHSLLYDQKDIFLTDIAKFIKSTSFDRIPSVAGFGICLLLNYHVGICIKTKQWFKLNDFQVFPIVVTFL